MIIFDVETDGLLEEATKIHCMVAKDTDLQTVHKAVGHEEVTKLFHDLVAQGHVFAGHNVMGYDLPVLEKVLNLKYEGEVFDTLVASRLIWSNLRELDSRKKVVKPSRSTKVTTENRRTLGMNILPRCWSTVSRMLSLTTGYINVL